MKRRRTRQLPREAGSVLVIALLIMVLMSLIGITLLSVASTEHSIASNALWSETALMAAEAGVNRSVSTLSAAGTGAAFGPIVLGGTATTYWSGNKAAQAAPTAPTFIRNATQAGYSIASCTAYNPCGYVFPTYQINASGTGPRGAIREVEVQAQYGPVAQ